MVGRNRKFEGHSDWMNEFNKIHNVDYYYDKKTQKKKTEKKKNRSWTLHSQTQSRIQSIELSG